MREVAGARVSTAQGEQRRWQCQTMPAGKATGGVDFDPRSGQVRGRVRKVRYFSGMAGAREGTNRLQMLKRNNGT